MNLVIVESPSKSKTIEKYLGEGYKVVSSMGHIRDLPKSKLGVDTDKNFEELYEISVSKKKVVSELKRLAKEASKIYLATDPDREGEAISWHIAQVMEEPAKSKVFQRVVFHEITKDAVLEAFKNPRQIDINLVSAQRARRILDRLVGYKLSPLLWKKIRYGLSAGRVQSVAVRFVVEREGEIENFKSESYSEIIVVLKSESVINRPSSIHPSDISHPTSNFIEAKLTHIANKPIYVNKKYNLFSGEYTTSATTLSSKEQVSIIVSDLEKSSYNGQNVREIVDGGDGDIDTGAGFGKFRITLAPGDKARLHPELFGRFQIHYFAVPDHKMSSCRQAGLFHNIEKTSWIRFIFFNSLTCYDFIEITRKS